MVYQCQRILATAIGVSKILYHYSCHKWLLSFFFFFFFIQVQLGDLELVPETTIPIDTSQCPADSTLPPNLCFPLVPATQPTPSNPLATPSSIPTCLAMQQVVSRDTLLGTTANSCSVSNSCTRLSCTYLGLYPFSVTILPCNTPPAVEFTVSDADGTMLVDETVSRSRTIPLSQLGPESAIYVVLDHPCGRPAIVLEVSRERKGGVCDLVCLPGLGFSSSHCLSILLGHSVACG